MSKEILENLENLDRAIRFDRQCPAVWKLAELLTHNHFNPISVCGKDIHSHSNSAQQFLIFLDMLQDKPEAVENSCLYDSLRKRDWQMLTAGLRSRAF